MTGSHQEMVSQATEEERSRKAEAVSKEVTLSVVIQCKLSKRTWEQKQGWCQWRTLHWEPREGEPEEVVMGQGRLRRCSGPRCAHDNGT